MNTERILALADRLEMLDLPGAFSMAAFVQPIEEAENDGDPLFMNDENVCGTCCCIGGWASMLYDAEMIALMDAGLSLAEIDALPTMLEKSFEDRGRLALGLTEKQAGELFYGGPYAPSSPRLTNTVAAKVLRHLAETGEVDWRKFVEERA